MPVEPFSNSAIELIFCCGSTEADWCCFSIFKFLIFLVIFFESDALMFLVNCFVTIYFTPFPSFSVACLINGLTAFGFGLYLTFIWDGSNLSIFAGF